MKKKGFVVKLQELKDYWFFYFFILVIQKWTETMTRGLTSWNWGGFVWLISCQIQFTRWDQKICWFVVKMVRHLLWNQMMTSLFISLHYFLVNFTCFFFCIGHLFRMFWSLVHLDKKEKISKWHWESCVVKDHQVRTHHLTLIRCF